MDHTLRAGTELGQKGPDLRWPMQVSCSVETMAPEQDCPPGQIGHQITGQGGSSWTLEEDPSWEACSRAKARHSWSRLHFQKPRLGGFRFRLDRCPVQRLVCLVRGSGCFIHDARCHLGGMVTPHPGTPLSQGSWVNTTPTHGPRWPSGCGDSPNGLEGQVFTFYWFSIYLWKVNLFLLVLSFCLLDEHR